MTEIERRFGDELTRPSFEGMLVNLLLGVSPDWQVSEFERILEGYFEQRTRRNGLRLPRAFEAGILLHAAEKHRLDGDIETARSLLSRATECHPSHQQLRQIEDRVDSDTPVDWFEVMFPGRANRKRDVGSGTDAVQWPRCRWRRG